MDHNPPALHISQSPSASVTGLGENSWHLEIPASQGRYYRLAQLDDHGSHPRNHFPWKPPLAFSLQARVSSEDVPGTWGFGLWNDPFSFMLAYNRLVPHLPTLPEAAWFFSASPQNYLSFRDDLPANGFLAATFSATHIPVALLALASPFLALSFIPGAAQWVRRWLRRMVKQDATQIHARLTDLHTYRLEWQIDQVRFYLDEVELLKTSIVPQPPLSLVIWIDNQYAALPPTGVLKFGTLPNPGPAWLEIREVRLQDHNPEYA